MAAPIAEFSSSQTSQTSQDSWNEWKARIGTLRSALLSRSPDSSLSELASGCLALYKDSDGSKQCNANDALANISGRNRSPLEIAFMWLGGWMPTSAITLVYSTLGAASRELDGVPAASNYTQTAQASAFLLSQEQLEAMETLQKITQETEACLSNELATLQMLVADQSMAEALAVDAFSILRTKDWKRGRELMEIKVAALTSLFIQANRLRLQTLEEVLRLLNPTQCAQCCISAFELVYAIENYV